MFAGEPGVIRLSDSRPGKRRYESISIPESVVLRVHERLSQHALEPDLTAGRPARVIRLRDLDRRVSQQPRYILKRDTGDQLPNRKSVSQAVRSAVEDAAA